MTGVDKLRHAEPSVDKDGLATGAFFHIGSLTNGSLSFLVGIQNGMNKLASSLTVLYMIVNLRLL